MKIEPEPQDFDFARWACAARQFVACHFARRPCLTGDANLIRWALLFPGRHYQLYDPPPFRPPAEFWRAFSGWLIGRVQCPDMRAAMSMRLDAVIDEAARQGLSIEECERLGASWAVGVVRVLIFEETP